MLTMGLSVAKLICAIAIAMKTSFEFMLYIGVWPIEVNVII